MPNEILTPDWGHRSHEKPFGHGSGPGLEKADNRVVQECRPGHAEDEETQRKGDGAERGAAKKVTAGGDQKRNQRTYH
jgi:hypothetical protein